MRTHLAIATATGILVGLPTAAIARPPTEVLIVNPPSQPAHVQITGTPDVAIVNPPSQPANVQITGTPTVKVDTQDGPLPVQTTATPFADSMSLTAAAGTTHCKPLEIPSGGRLRLTGVVASATGSDRPDVALRVWSERDPETAAGNGIRIDLPVPLKPMDLGTSFRWGGSLTTAIMLGTGSIAALDGLGTDVSGCVSASAGNNTTTHLYLSGEYL